MLSFRVTQDYKYLILCGSRVLCIANVENLTEDIKFKMIFEIQDATYVSNRMLLIGIYCGFDVFVRRYTKQEYVGNDADFFLFLTNVGAPMHHLIEVDIRNKKPRNNIDVIVPVSDQSFHQIFPKHFNISFVLLQENLDGHGVLKFAFKYSGYYFLNYIEKAQVHSQCSKSNAMDKFI